MKYLPMKWNDVLDLFKNKLGVGGIEKTKLAVS